TIPRLQRWFVVRETGDGRVLLGERLQHRIGPGGGADDPLAQAQCEQDLRGALVEGDDPLGGLVDRHLLAAVLDGPDGGRVGGLLVSGGTGRQAQGGGEEEGGYTHDGSFEVADLKREVRS